MVFIADNLITNPVEEQKSQTQKNFLLGMLVLKNLVIITYIPNVFKGTIKKQWDIRNFPFDTQILVISIEGIYQSQLTFFFSIDETSSIANDDIPNGWSLKSFNVVAAESNYPTIFGDPSTTAITN